MVAAASRLRMLAWRWPAVKGWAQTGLLGRPEAGLLVGLLLLAFCVVSLLTDNSPGRPSVVVPATVLLIACAPPPARKLAPVAMVVARAAGIVLTVSRAGRAGVGRGPGGLGHDDGDPVHESWRTVAAAGVLRVPGPSAAG